MKPNCSCNEEKRGFSPHNNSDRHVPKSCKVQDMFLLFGKKYTLPIIRFLLEKKVLRFNEIESLVNANPRTLTLRLREMESHGLINRRLYQEVPLKVEYTLTPAGEGLRDLITGMIKWAQSNY